MRNKKVITIVIIIAAIIAFTGTMATLQDKGVIDTPTTEEAKKEETSDTKTVPEKDPVLEGFTEPRSVPNDATGKWKVSTVATTKSDKDYIIPFIEYYMAEADGTYGIVNFTNKVTLCISKNGSIATVDVHEYIDKEELDASQLFSGTLIGSYTVDLDSKTIKE